MGPLHDSSRFKSGTPVPSPVFFGLGRNVSTWRAGLADKKRGRGPGSLRSGRRSARNAPRRERLKRPKTTAPTATQTNVPDVAARGLERVLHTRVPLAPRERPRTSTWWPTAPDVQPRLRTSKVRTRVQCNEYITEYYIVVLVVPVVVLYKLVLSFVLWYAAINKMHCNKTKCTRHTNSHRPARPFSQLVTS